MSEVKTQELYIRAVSTSISISWAVFMDTKVAVANTVSESSAMFR